MIRSNDIWQSLLLVEHLDGEKKGRAKKTRGTFIQSVLCRSPWVAGSRGIRIGSERQLLNRLDQNIALAGHASRVGS